MEFLGVPPASSPRVAHPSFLPLTPTAQQVGPASSSDAPPRSSITSPRSKSHIWDSTRTCLRFAFVSIIIITTFLSFTPLSFSLCGHPPAYFRFRHQDRPPLSPPSTRRLSLLIFGFPRLDLNHSPHGSTALCVSREPTLFPTAVHRIGLLRRVLTSSRAAPSTERLLVQLLTRVARPAVDRFACQPYASASSSPHLLPALCCLTTVARPTLLHLLGYTKPG